MFNIVLDTWKTACHSLIIYYLFWCELSIGYWQTVKVWMLFFNILPSYKLTKNLVLHTAFDCFFQLQPKPDIMTSYSHLIWRWWIISVRWLLLCCFRWWLRYRFRPAAAVCCRSLRSGSRLTAAGTWLTTGRWSWPVCCCCQLKRFLCSDESRDIILYLYKKWIMYHR